VDEIKFGENSDSEKEDREKQGPSICKWGNWKNLLFSQLLERNALSHINRQTFSILSGLWVTSIPKIHTCLHTSIILQWKLSILLINKLCHNTFWPIVLKLNCIHVTSIKQTPYYVPLKIKIPIPGNSEACSYVELFHSCIWEGEDVLSVTDIAYKPIIHVYM